MIPFYGKELKTVSIKMNKNLLHNGLIIIKLTWKSTQKLKDLKVMGLFYGEKLTRIKETMVMYDFGGVQQSLSENI